MPRRVSSAIGVPSADLEAQGVFDAFTDLDSWFSIDPHLIGSSTAPELASARQLFEDHWIVVLKLLQASTQHGDAPWREAVRRFVFREPVRVTLGVSRSGTNGNGIGPVLAASLCRTASEIVRAGCHDLELFELLGLFQENIGPDRLSDMTARLITPCLMSFSQAVGLRLGASVRSVQSDGHSYMLPVDTDTGLPVTLLPRDILVPIPVAHSWADIDTVAAHNSELRGKVNRIIGSTWKYATQRIQKRTLKEAVLANPALLEDLIFQYRQKPRAGYDFARDSEAAITSATEAEAIASEYALALDAQLLSSADGAFELVRMICLRFGEVVENNRMSELLYNDDGTPRKERVAQRVFYLLADSYCRANDLDITPEANAGAGPVDFKFSRGFSLKVTVEIKLSSHRGLVAGFRKQLPAYNRAEGTNKSILLVVRTTESEATIEAVRKAEASARASGESCPLVIVLDGRLTEAASRR